MDVQRFRVFPIAILISAILLVHARASTDPFDVAALEDLYRALNSSPQLTGWRIGGGGPCDGESWIGVSCSGSSVTHIQIPGLDLWGSLGTQLHNLQNLKYMDVSSNRITGEIPNSLPPNASHVNMAFNNLSQSIPYSLASLKHLRYLNVSHNSLSGPLGDVFGGLPLKEMDLSYNNFTGDLPSSFASLSNLTSLFLQKNKFTGSVIYLSDLPLTDLNIQDNEFSGVIPEQFQFIPHLWFWGNIFHAGANYTAWKFPLDIVPLENNISALPKTESSAVQNFPAAKVVGHKTKRIGLGGIASMLGGIALLAACITLLIVVHVNRTRKPKLRSLGSSISTVHSLPISTIGDYACTAPEESPIFANAQGTPILRHVDVPPGQPNRTKKTSRRKSFSNKCDFPTSAKSFTVAELQGATNSFSELNLLGEGSLGSVYRAEFPNGQPFAVKTINMVSLSFHEEEQFLDVIRIASQLRHPNIVPLLGYCIEYGQHLLVFEYVRNLSLDDALHNEIYKPLSWGLRLRIALGVARAIDYLHSTTSPPVAHCNIKAANILLDEELMPRLTDSGLATLRSLTRNSVKLKASEIAIFNTGYIAPEHGQPGGDSTKADVYAFGVLLLELLTGRRPFDNDKPREEQLLVKWASSRLHDGESLEQMVDPGITRTLPSKALSELADIISLCIQPQKEFRPMMSEIVESLRSLMQKVTMIKNTADGTIEIDPLNRSFRSTHTRFIGSPSASYLSM